MLFKILLNFLINTFVCDLILNSSKTITIKLLFINILLYFSKLNNNIFMEPISNSSLPLKKEHSNDLTSSKGTLLGREISEQKSPVTPLTVFFNKLSGGLTDLRYNWKT